MSRPDTPFPRHWLYYIALKILLLGAAVAIAQVTLNPPTDNSRAIRLGSFILVRDVIEEELEHAFAGRKTARDALASAVRRGNELLRQFERASR